MEQILCCHCGLFFDPSPRHKNQRYCQAPACIRARKAAWKRDKMRSDPDYRLNQILSNRKWARANPGYWKKYRQQNPAKAQRNRLLQTVRNRRRALRAQAEPGSKRALIAKVDASIGHDFKVVGQYWLVPLIAKVDALKVNIFEVPPGYG